MKKDIGYWASWAAVPAMGFSAFTVMPLLFSRPFAPLTFVLFAGPGLLSILLVAVLPRSLARKQRMVRALTVILGTLIAEAFVLPSFICASVSMPMMANQHSANM